MSLVGRFCRNIPLKERPQGLRESDVLVLVEARSVVAWVQALFHWGVRRWR